MSESGEDLGARLRAARGRALTQRQLAEAADVSVDLVRKLEQGIRKTAQISSLARIAHAVDLDLAELMGKRASLPGADLDAGVMALRRAVTPVDDLLGAQDQPVDESLDLTDLADLDGEITRAWGEYWSGRWAALTAQLPELLPRARAALHAAPLDRRPRAAECLARAYWCAGSVLVHLGQTDTAWQAIRQALDTAKQGEDELLAATLRGSIGWQLLVQGRYDEARRVCAAAACSIEPSNQSTAAPERLSTFGSLVLTAATAAGRDEQRAEAEHLVDEADAIARRTGMRRDYETFFGPAQTLMQRVDVKVTSEDYVGALTAARAMPRDSGLPLAARCRHMADQALAHARLGHQDKALDAVLAAESAGPDWIKHQTLPRQVVAELLDTARPLRLRKLAGRLGVTV